MSVQCLLEEKGKCLLFKFSLFLFKFLQPDSSNHMWSCTQSGTKMIVEVEEEVKQDVHGRMQDSFHQNHRADESQRKEIKNMPSESKWGHTIKADFFLFKSQNRYRINN